MKLKFYTACLMIFICAVGIGRAEVENLRPLPGAEYNGGRKALKKREFRTVRIGDLAEGTPEWVLHQAAMSVERRDFARMKQYMAPHAVWNISQLRPDQSTGWTNYRLGPDDDVRIADGLEESDWCYVYMTFLQKDGLGRMGGYYYFYKRDGRWINTSQNEWRRGKLSPVPKN